MLGTGTAGAADGDGTGDAADRSAGGQGGAEASIQPEESGRGEIDAAEGDKGDDERLADGGRAGLQDDREGQGGTHQHDAGLDEVFGAQCLVQPGGKTNGVADGQADEESHQRAFQLGSLEPGVAGQQRDQHGQPIQRQQALAEFRDVVADAGGADGQRYQQQRIQVDERGQRLAEGGQTFAGRAPAAELHGNELERTGFAGQ